MSLFCYASPALPALLDMLAVEPTLLLVTPGMPAAQVHAQLGPTLRRGALRATELAYLTQADYDRLLWACDLNFVRGEDSFVRAQWAAKPFVWQAYPQPDDVRLRKMHAFLDRFLDGGSPALATPLRQLWNAWNASAAPRRSETLPDRPDWRAHCEAWRDKLVAQPDLVTQLLRHASRTR